MPLPTVSLNFTCIPNGKGVLEDAMDVVVLLTNNINPQIKYPSAGQHFGEQVRSPFFKENTPGNKKGNLTP